MNTKKGAIPNIVREKIKEVEQKNGVELSTIQKVFCSIEGPVVSILDVLYGDVNLFVLDQHIEEANELVAEHLEINVGDEVDLREVIVHKHGRPLVYGISFIPKDRCSNTVIEKLLKEDQTTGRIILEHEIETLTKINDIVIEEPRAKLQNLFHVNEDLLIRDYTLIHKKKPVIWSKEIYPLSYFRE